MFNSQKSILLWAFTVACICSLASCANEIQKAETPDDISKEIGDVLDHYRADLGIPGIAVAYAEGDKLGDSNIFTSGYSDLEKQILLAKDDRMLSGSVGKTYFAAVAMQFVEEELLDLDAPIKTYLGEKEWFSRIPNAESITTRMLLNHTSGIAEHVADEAFTTIVANEPDKVWGHEELLQYTFDKEPLFPAGQGWSYADTNYILMGVILEEISGKALYDELQERVLTPLGLEDTVPSDSREIPGLIPGYASENSIFHKPGKTIADGKFNINPQLEWTGGGIASTTRDLARWGWLLFNGKAFSPDYMEEFLDGKETTLGDDTYGLGVMIWNNDTLGTCYGHSGIFPGYLTHLIYLKDYDLSLAVQFNSSGHGITRDVMRNLLYDVAHIVLRNRN